MPRPAHPDRRGRGGRFKAACGGLKSAAAPPCDPDVLSGHVPPIFQITDRMGSNNLKTRSKSPNNN